ncbi:hypothetical protein ACXU4B_08770 [Dyella soli]|uniref:Uncharacterized protein n=1 Tax=Dyella soli TaxID=522319 RepID=A0A4R0YVV7_9GAMM|nr:hypothetical protein [Dyella soli]TCI11038.1 hypothetical protein EZM97_19660 [Dyella soli]
MAGATVAQAAEVSGSAQAVSVGTALHDKEAYMNQQYSPDTLPKNVLDLVQRSGAKPSNFKRIAIDSKIVIDKVGAAVPMSSENDSLYLNAGHGLVKHLSVSKLNGFEQATVFALSYRGFIDLRSQSVLVGAATMPAFSETTNISHFDAAMEAAHSTYSATQAYSTPGSAPVGVQYECTAGNPYPASQLNPDIAGSAHDVDCQSLNVNGIVTGTVRYSYLEQYGLAIILHTKSVNMETSKTVTSFKAE